MRRINICAILIILFPFTSECQNLNHLYDDLFDGRIFIYTKPLTTFHFERYSFRGDFEEHMDSLRYQEIITNSKNPDSSFWTDQEAKDVIIVNEDETRLKWKKIKPKFNNIDKKQEERYRTEIYFYNKKPRERLIYRFSRPIFDNKKEFAVIQWRYSKVGYGLRVYKLRNGERKELFTIETYF